MNSKELAAEKDPDYSSGTAITSVANFIPGVTASLLAFSIFGTTKPFRRIYATNLGTCCGLHRKAPPTPPDSANSMERGWRKLAGPGSLNAPGYRCSVRGGDAEDSIELASNTDGERRATKHVAVIQEYDDTSHSAPSSIGAGENWEKRVSQPWRT
jgi:hypothetical protein